MGYSWTTLRHFPGEEWQTVLDALIEKNILQDWMKNPEVLQTEIEKTELKLQLLKSYQENGNEMIKKINEICAFAERKREESRRERLLKEAEELKRQLGL